MPVTGRISRRNALNALTNPSAAVTLRNQLLTTASDFTSITVANTIYIGNSTVNTSVNSSFYGATSNNALFLEGSSLSDITAIAANLAANAYSNAIAYSGLAANAYSNGVTYTDSKSATAYANGVTYTDSAAATAYINAINFSSNGSAITSGTISPARLPLANSTSNGAVLILDSVVNTSVSTYAAAPNSVKTSYDAALAANTRANSAQTAAIAAYTNAISYTDTAVATSYSNGVTYTDSKAATAYSNAVLYAASNTYVNTTFAPKASPTFTGGISAVDLVLTGNLTVSGTTTYINTSTLNIGDAIITLNADLPGATAPTENAGFEISRGSSANVQFLWDETSDIFTTNGQPLIVSVLTVGNSTVSATVNSTIFTGTANNATNLGGTAAAGYQTTAGLAAAVAILPANAATYVVGNGTISIGNSTANVWANSVIFKVANSTVTANVSPLGFFAGIVTVNTTMLAVGANNYMNATVSFIGNSTVNAYIDNNGLYVANSTSNTKIQVPSTVAYSATNYFLHANGTWTPVTGAPPGGSNTQVQFNDSASFNGTAGMVFDKTTNNFTVSNTVLVGANVIFTTASAVIGNSTVNTQVNSSVLSTGTVNHSVAANVGANVSLTTTGLIVGNSTVNSVSNSVAVTFNTATTSMRIDGSSPSSGLQFFPNSSVSSAMITAGLRMSTAMSLGWSTAQGGGGGSWKQYFDANTTHIIVTGGTTINSTAVVATLANFTTSANVGANVRISTTNIQVGNSTANLNANSIIMTVANSTSSSNQTPLGLVAGISVVNSISVAVGANTIVSAGGISIGNTTVNAVANSTSILLNGGGYIATGGLDVGYVAKTANYTLTGADYFVSCSTATASFTVTLPTAVGRPGQMYTVKRTDGGANTVTIATTSSQTIDGQTTRVLVNKNDAWTVVSDNANWQVVSKPTIIPSSSANVVSPFAWNSDSYNHFFITGQGAALTINADAGSPSEGQIMTFRIKDDGTARALTWTTGSAGAFRVIGTSLPSTTVISKIVYVGCRYNSTDSRWDVVSVSQEA